MGEAKFDWLMYVPEPDRNRPATPALALSRPGERSPSRTPTPRVESGRPTDRLPWPYCAPRDEKLGSGPPDRHGLPFPPPQREIPRVPAERTGGAPGECDAATAPVRSKERSSRLSTMRPVSKTDFVLHVHTRSCPPPVLGSTG